MQLQTAVFCDFAAIYGEKFNIVGIYDTIESEELPVTVELCVLAMVVSWGRGEEGIHEVRVHFTNEDGRQTLDDIVSSADVQVPESRSFVTIKHVIKLHGLCFSVPGIYQAGIYGDGELLGTRHLQIVSTS